MDRPDLHCLTYDEFCEAVDTSKIDGNMFPKGISDSVALQILFEHFIEPEFYIAYSCGKEQANTEMIAEILRRFPAGSIKKIPKFKKKKDKSAVKWLKSL